MTADTPQPYFGVVEPGTVWPPRQDPGDPEHIIRGHAVGGPVDGLVILGDIYSDRPVARGDTVDGPVQWYEMHAMELHGEVGEVWVHTSLSPEQARTMLEERFPTPESRYTGGCITTADELEDALHTVWALPEGAVRPDFDFPYEIARRTATLLVRVVPELRDDALAQLAYMQAAADELVSTDQPGQ